jgi:hypothetical protein
MGLYQSGGELTEGETAQIVAFLKTLTGEYNGKPITTTNSREDIRGHE